MKRPFPLVFICFIVVISLCSGCLTDSSSDDKKDDDDNPVFTKKTVTITQGATKLIENEHTNFKVTSTPAPDPSEWLIYRFTGPDTARYVLQDAHIHNELWRESFEAGDWTLSVAIYDSTEFKALGELAPDHGSATLPIAVRKITTTLAAEPGKSSQDITFHANSPERDWIHTNADYVWTFGDGDMVTTTGVDSVAHHYDVHGQYQVIVNIKCALYEDDNSKYRVAADTLNITVEPDVTTSLELVISPQDTIWTTASGVTLTAEPSLDRYEYPDRVKLVIDYDDGETKEDESYLYDWSISHRYYYPGTYMLSVGLYVLETDELLAEGTATIHINNLYFLQETNYIITSVNGFTNRHTGTLDGDVFTEKSDWENLWGFGWSTSEIEWNGLDFSYESTYTSGTQTTVRRIEGRLSHEGSTVTSLTYTLDFIDTDYQDTGTEWTRYERLVLANVPLTAHSTYNHRFYEESTEVGQYVADFEAWERMEHLDGTVGYTYYDYFDWQNTSEGTPSLTVEFKKW